MNSATIRGAYHSIISSNERGDCLSESLKHLTTQQRLELFDTLISCDQLELGRLVESWLMPVVERHIAAELQRKLIFELKGDNEA